jgi:hypothetical protein
MDQVQGKGSCIFRNKESRKNGGSVAELISMTVTAYRLRSNSMIKIRPGRPLPRQEDTLCLFL